MKIPKELPQFKHKDVLLIVSGKQDAALYEAHDGVIDRIDSFRIPNPRYSDNEGAFNARGGGGSIRAGTYREIQDSDVIRDFMHELKARVKEFSRKSSNVSDVYIFAPSKTKNIIPSALPSKWRGKVSSVIEGNYYYRDPVYILQKFKSES